MAFSPGDIVGQKYRLDRKLGQGGLGEVWVATDATLGRQVAIKFLLAAQGIGLAERSLLLREARAAATVAHPNIVVVHGVDVTSEPPFLDLELLAGPSLDERLAAVPGTGEGANGGDSGRFGVNEAVEVALQVARGLDHAHRVAGVVHRDIKPANLVFDGHGTWKIIDFGIARFHHATTHPANRTADQTSHGYGTPSFGAPEQFLGAWEDVDARADLYSLGCVLFTMLTGRPPFDADNPYAVVVQHVSTPPPSLRSLRPDAPAALERLVGELIAKRPDDRPASAAEVVRRLEAILHTRTVAQSPDTAPAARLDLGRSLRSRLARPRTVFASLGFAALASCLAVVFVFRAHLFGIAAEGAQPKAAQAALRTGKWFFTSDNSSDCLDQDWHNDTEHPDVLWYPCNFNVNEQWDVLRNSDGTYTLQNVASGNCLAPGPVANGAATLAAVHCDQSKSQEWLAISAPSGSGAFLENEQGAGCLSETAVGLALDASCRHIKDAVWAEQRNALCSPAPGDRRPLEPSISGFLCSFAVGRRVGPAPACQAGALAMAGL